MRSTIKAKRKAREEVMKGGEKGKKRGMACLNSNLKLVSDDLMEKTKPKPPSLMSRMTHPHKVYPPRAARGDFRWGRFSDVLPQESWSVRLIRIVFEMYEGASWEFLHWSKRKKPNNTTSPSSSASSSRRRQRVCVHSPSTSCCFISNYGSGFVVVCGEFHGGFVVVRVCSR
ncbi:hypothetical protein JHK82_014897 [Glycine max]|nr:hypothetical protein JHK85_015269 [Glycine max]KAG5045509.1 hypothetical protein JHK86_014915 [Glycine max]KAG5148016.1 hypothetical protein JHK82_014897 [Glycine max]